LTGFGSPWGRPLQPPRASPPRLPSRRCIDRSKPTSSRWIAQFARAMSPLEDGTVFSRTSFRRDHRAQLVTRLVRAALAANPSRLSAGGAVLAVPTSDALCRAGMSSRDLHSIDVDRTALARPHQLVPTTPDPASTGDRLKCRLDETRAPSAGFRLRPFRDRSDYASHAFSRE